MCRQLPGVLLYSLAGDLLRGGIRRVFDTPPASSTARIAAVALFDFFCRCPPFSGIKKPPPSFLVCPVPSCYAGYCRQVPAGACQAIIPKRSARSKDVLSNGGCRLSAQKSPGQNKTPAIPAGVLQTDEKTAINRLCPNRPLLWRACRSRRRRRPDVPVRTACSGKKRRLFP